MVVNNRLEFILFFLSKEYDIPLLLFFIPPSCMVVPNREIVNINSFFNILAMSYSIEINIFSEDINIDKLRDKSIVSSSNFLRNL